MRDLRELQRHEPQLRELARCLIGDEHLADDLVQETYVSALERTAMPEKPRRWLRETLRLKARHMRSSEASRASRERTAAVAERAEVGEQDDELSAVHRALREELERLEQPYHAMLFARFVEGEPPRSIASRLELPVRTVNTRLTRGIRKLRERLDRRLGAVWMPVLALGLRERRPVGGLPRVRLASAAAVALGATALLASWFARPEPVQVARAKEPARVAAEPVAGGEPRVPTAPSDTSARVPIPRLFEPVARTAGPRYRGIVTDLEGRPLAGLTVVLDEGECVHEERSLDSFSFELRRPQVLGTTSAADGAWVLDPDEDKSGRIVARGNGYRAVIGELVPAPGEERSLVVVAAPERAITGLVVDAEGQPVEGATITATPSATYLAGLTRRKRTWVPVLPKTVSGEDGAFGLAAYDLQDGRVEIEKAGFLTKALIVPGGPLDLRLELLRTPATVVLLNGRVVDGGGAPLEGAMVVAGSASARSAADGSFQLGPGGLAGARVLWAVAPDRCPVRVRLSRTADGAVAAPEELVLTLAEPCRSIEGTVRGADGMPLAGAIVWCADATHMGGVRSTWFVERYTFAGGEWDMPFTTRADDEGRFVIPYLIDRDYRVGALHVSSLTSALSAPVPSGTEDIVLRVPTEGPRSPVAGLVLARDGRPLAGVRVTVKRTTLDVKIGAGGNLRAALTFGSVETDDEGWFVIEELPLHGLHLALDGEAVLSDVLEIPAEGPREHLEVVLARRSRVRVNVVTGRRVDHVALVDDLGLKLPLYDASDYANNSEWGARTDVAVKGRPSVLIIAPDTAVALIAYGGGAIVERIPVELSPDGTLAVDL